MNKSKVRELKWILVKHRMVDNNETHGVKFASIERENIFLQAYLQLLCCLVFPHLLNVPQNCFSQNLFCFSYFYRGRSLFLTFVVHRGSYRSSFVSLIFVTACFDNSGFSGVVTLKSPVGFLLCRFFPFVSKSLCQFNFRCIISLIGDLFVLPRILYANLIN